MAKKSPKNARENFGKNAVAKRRTEQTVESLKRQADAIRRILVDFDSAVKVMEDSRLDDILVDGSTRYDRGVQELTNYVGNVRMAIARFTLGSTRKS